MKNKPDPALLGGSYLFKEIKKRTPKSRETIPLNWPPFYGTCFRYHELWSMQDEGGVEDDFCTDDEEEEEEEEEEE
jgi:hypothetical protein